DWQCFGYGHRLFTFILFQGLNQFQFISKKASFKSDGLFTPGCTSDTANGGSIRRLGGKISCLLDATSNEIGSPNYNL
ncbi:MAG: hypothetical protein QNJ42_25465, partial [Crocosphaera sp.]|nr:hypothetical protein [Crocosphaera sp.]